MRGEDGSCIAWAYASVLYASRDRMEDELALASDGIDALAAFNVPGDDDGVEGRDVGSGREAAIRGGPLGAIPRDLRAVRTMSSLGLRMSAI